MNKCRVVPPHPGASLSYEKERGTDAPDNCRWTLRTRCSVREAGHKRTQGVWSRWCKTSTVYCREPTHETLPMTRSWGRKPDRQGRSGFQGFRKASPCAHLKDDICLSDACFNRLLPNFCDTGRRPSPISSQIRINLELQSISFPGGGILWDYSGWKECFNLNSFAGILVLVCLANAFMPLIFFACCFFARNVLRLCYGNHC